MSVADPWRSVPVTARILNIYLRKQRIKQQQTKNYREISTIIQVKCSVPWGGREGGGRHACGICCVYTVVIIGLRPEYSAVLVRVYSSPILLHQVVTSLGAKNEGPRPSS